MMNKAVSKKFLFIFLAVSLALIIAGAFVFGFAGLNADSTTRYETVVEVTDSGKMALDEDFRENLRDFCLDEIKEGGFKVKSDSYTESTSVGSVLTFVVKGKANVETVVADLRAALSSSASSVEGVDEAVVSVTYHGVENAPYYNYIWRSAVGAAVVAVVLFAYVAIRFNLGMGITALAAAVHDVLLTLGLIAILRIPAGVGFIGVLAFSLLLSIMLNLLVFGKMRADFRLDERKGLPARENVALSAKASQKSVLTVVILAAAAVVVFGVIGAIIGFDMTSYMLGALAALLVSAYSSLFLAPAIFAAIKEKMDANREKKAKYNYESEKKREKERKASEKTKTAEEV